MTILPRISGIYRIVCLVNQRIYIGSSINLIRRFGEHKRYLNAGTHHSHYLQSAWNKYGVSNFAFEVIELCEPDALLEREQHYLDTLNPFLPNGYNTSRDVVRFAVGLSRSVETRAKMSAAKKGTNRYVKSPEHRAKLSATLKGRARVVRQDARRGDHSKTYIVTTPLGVEITVKNLFKFCLEVGISQSHMSAVAGGKRKHHKRWLCRHA